MREGSDEAEICTTDDFCNDPSVISVEPNMDSHDSYENWVTKLDLQCDSKLQFGLLNSMMIFGNLLTLLFLPRLADLTGRYGMIYVGKPMSLIFLVLCILPQNKAMLLVALFLYGLSLTIREQIRSIYVYEHLSEANY